MMGRRRRHRWRRKWSASWRRLLHIFTTILMMVMVFHCHLRAQITNGNKFAVHLLVIIETAQCSVATRLSPTSTEKKLTGTARRAAPVRFAQNNVTCYSESRNTQKPQNTITLYQRSAATILHTTQQTFRYSDLQLNNVPLIRAAASILFRNSTALGILFCEEICGCENNTLEHATEYVLLLRSDLFQTHTVALHTFYRLQRNGRKTERL